MASSAASTTTSLQGTSLSAASRPSPFGAPASTSASASASSAFGSAPSTISSPSPHGIHGSKGTTSLIFMPLISLVLGWPSLARACALLPSWFPPLLPVLPSENYTRRMWMVIVCGHRHLPPNGHCRQGLEEGSSDPVSSSARRYWAVINRHQFRLELDL
ncbi:hypothetical protein CRG98_026112 [Punica granatum]|uniref:Uncharacterized protein n=1 Tax=Punica granatum TaxID=22663 RepID=A0A2I0JB88_PUNGR|nr:hypothetical protein CRG98_026112 [Punica granatum]